MAKTPEEAERYVLSELERESSFVIYPTIRTQGPIFDAINRLADQNRIKLTDLGLEQETAYRVTLVKEET